MLKILKNIHYSAEIESLRQFLKPFYKPIKRFLITLFKQLLEVLKDVVIPKAIYIAMIFGVYNFFYHTDTLSGNVMCNNRLIIPVMLLPLAIIRNETLYDKHGKVAKKMLSGTRWIILIPLGALILERFTDTRMPYTVVYRRLEPIIVLWLLLVSSYLVLYGCYKFVDTFDKYALAWTFIIILIFIFFM